MTRLQHALLGTFLAISIFSLSPYSTSAASLTFVRDLITDSGPGLPVSHMIDFRVTNAVPASGHIVITPEANSFNISTSLAPIDIDLLVDSGSGYINRNIAAVPSATDDGVTITSGAQGSIDIKLNSTAGLSVGSKIRVIVGSNAAFGGTGITSLDNPLTVGSYPIAIATRNTTNQTIDSASAMIAVVDPVSISMVVGAIIATLSNGLPSGNIPAGSANIELYVETDIPATCRYSSIPNKTYDEMVDQFPQQKARAFYVDLSGFVDGTQYFRYIRCKSPVGVLNPDDYVITFTLGPTPPSQNSLDQTQGAVGRGGVGSVPDGSAALYLSSVLLIGQTSPFSTVTILVDGKISSNIQSNGTGAFRASVPSLERGVYTFGIYSTDSSQSRSSTFSSTLTLGQGTSNTISDIIVAPSFKLAKDSVDIGEDAHVSGFAVPGAVIGLIVRQSGTSSAALASQQILVATTTANGAWNIVIDTSTFSKGTYLIKARTVLTKEITSDYSGPLFLDVGQGARSRKAKNPDLNLDGKVNLIDFSIMLSHWLEDYDLADLTSDGIVNLSDVSVLLFYWTG